MKSGTQREDGMVFYGHGTSDRWMVESEFDALVKSELTEAQRHAARLRAALSLRDRVRTKAQKADLRKRMKEATGENDAAVVRRREKQRRSYWENEGKPRALERLKRMGLA